MSEPHPQESRISEVLAPPSQSAPSAWPDRIPVAERVRARLAEDDDGAPTSYFGRQLQMSLLALQEYANEFDREGQREKAVQIHMVVLKHLAKTEAATPPPIPSAEQIAAMEAEVARMSDDELAAAMKKEETEPDSGS